MNLSKLILHSRKATHWTVLTLTGVAFLLRTLTLGGQSLWRDEVDAIRFSDWPPAELLRGLFQHGHNGPLFFLALRPWRAITGNSEFALRYPSALMGSLAIPLGFVLARQLGFSRRAGVLLGLLLATSPYLVWYGQEAKMYALLVVLVTLAFIAYLRALSGAGRRWWITFVVVTSLSFYTHILSPLMLLVYGVVAWLRWAQFRQQWRAWLLSMACLILPYVPLAIWQIPLLTQGFQSGHPDYSAQKMIALLFQLYSSGLIQFLGFTGGVLYVFLLLCGLFLHDRPHPTPFPKREGAKPPSLWGSRGGLGNRWLLATWTLLPPLAVYLISLRVEIFEDRYLIYITPAFYLIVVLGIILVRRRSPWLASFCLGLILTFNLIGIWQQQRRPIKADFRGVAGYLYNQPTSPSAIMVQIPYLQHTFNYYYTADYQLLEGLWTNNGKTAKEAATEMQQRTANLTDIWLIVAEEDLWDSRGLTRAWLDENAELLDEANFVRADLYHYRMPAQLTEKTDTTTK